MKKSHLKILSQKFLVVAAALLLSQISFAQSDGPLREVYKNNFYIGAALNEENILQKNDASNILLESEFNSITAENVFKWEKIHPSEGEYNFELPDKFVALGEKLNMQMIGHTLIWHQQTPEWVFKNSDGNYKSREELLTLMEEHITTVVGRYKGKINGWDVVNEALNEDGTLKQSEWVKIIGEDYLQKAFEFACQADPNTELYYNDFSLENEPKRNGAIELIKMLRSKGIKIDAVGLQGHYKMDWPTTSQLDSTIKAFAKLGLKVMITELDIDVLPYNNIPVGADISMNVKLREEFNPYPDRLPEENQNMLAERYADLFKVFLVNDESVSRITFWGISDDESWLHDWPIKGRTNYPLLFDHSGKPKPAYYAVKKIPKESK
ncbi:MAG: endo-1,4-beta-xylanase [Ignavibacteriales bacterium]|nr:MAG: endo-1,4-beta-xylanase [Ignavibacteriales bacterium]